MSATVAGHREATTPDGVLVQEAAAGSGTSYGELYDRYADQVYNYCLRVIGSPDDAADATQEAFVNVLRRLQDDDKPVLAFSSYLFAAARNESYALMRRGARVEPSETVQEQPVAVDVEIQPEPAAMLHDSQDAVRRANATLAPRHREVLALRELGDHSYDEIGRIMGISENSAAQLIWRARTKLREAMTAGAVASVVATSPDCERAQVLLTRIQDGEPVDELDRFWLDQHVDECGSCRSAKGMLLEVAAFYCAWVPVAAGLALKADTLTAAGSLLGADWSGVASGGSSAGAGGAGGAGAGAGANGAAAGGASGLGGVGAGGAVAGVATLAAVGIALSAVIGGGGADLERKATEPERSTSAEAPAKASKRQADAREAPARISSLAGGLLGARAPLGALPQSATPGAEPNGGSRPEGQGRGGPDSGPPGTEPPQNPTTPGPRGPDGGPPGGGRPRGEAPGGGPGGGGPGSEQPPGNPDPLSNPGEPPVDTTPPDPPAEQPPEQPLPPQSDGCTWPGGGGGPGSCPPGHGGTPPGHGGTPPGQGKPKRSAP